MQNYSTYETSNQAPVVGVTISDCGSYVAFNSDVQNLRIVYLKHARRNFQNWNNSLRTIFDVQVTSPIRCLEFGVGIEMRSRLPHRTRKRRTPYGYVDNVCLLAVGLQSGHVKIYSLIPNEVFERNMKSVVEYGGKSILVLKDGIQDLTTVSFSLDGSLRLASASIDGKIRLWDMWDDGNMYKMIDIANSFRPTGVAWGHNSTHLCIVGSKSRGYIYQSEKPCRKVATLSQVHYNDISNCKYSMDESLLATSSYDTSVVIWCGGTYKPLLQIWQVEYKPSRIVIGGMHNRFVRKFEFSPDCVNVVSVCDDQYIRFWNIDDTSCPTRQIRVESTSRKLSLTDVKFSPDGSFFLVSTSDGRILMVDNKKNSDISLINLCRQTVRSRLARIVNNVMMPRLDENSLYRQDVTVDKLLNNSMNFTKKSRNRSVDFTNIRRGFVGTSIEFNEDPLDEDECEGDLESDIESLKPNKKMCFDTFGISEISKSRRRSAADIYRDKKYSDLLVRDVVDELPLPTILKSYIQFGLPGSEVVDNKEPRRLLLLNNQVTTELDLASGMT